MLVVLLLIWFWQQVQALGEINSRLSVNRLHRKLFFESMTAASFLEQIMTSSSFKEES